MPPCVHALPSACLWAAVQLGALVTCHVVAASYAVEMGKLASFGLCNSPVVHMVHVLDVHVQSAFGMCMRDVHVQCACKICMCDVPL